MSSSEAQLLLQTVIQGGYCIGCGACAAVAHSPFRMALDEIGRYQASADSAAVADATSSLLDVCPFADGGPDEDAVARQLYASACVPHPRIGYHLANYAGYVVERSFRRDGSSGGLVSWLCVELLRRGLADAVVHVTPAASTSEAPALFSMSVSRSEKEILAGAKSRYYPIEMSRVLRELQQTPGRYVVVGLPCFIKAVRRLALRDGLPRERVAYCVGLVCGHLKTAAFADMLAWQMGIPPGELAAIDFRRKIAGEPASAYGVEARGRRSDPSRDNVCRNSELYGFNWGYGFFKYNACDYCDDVMAETADIGIGDAWLPQYIADSNGTNVVVVRNAELNRIIEEAASAGRLRMDSVAAETIAQSQDAGLRHRREGLAYRLFLADRAGRWRPRKRVAASDVLTSRDKNIQRQRMILAERSHAAFRAAKQAGDFRVFQMQMAPYVRQYSLLYRKSLWRRAAARIRRVLLRLVDGRPKP